MKEIGDKNRIRVVDLHGYLMENGDRGFLWWDSCHLTDFGQELAAKVIFETILHEIERMPK